MTCPGAEPPRAAAGTATRRRLLKLTRWLPVVIVGLALGCAAGSPPAALPSGAASIDLVIPFRINDEMRAWLHRQVPSGINRLERMKRLLYALQEDEDGLRLSYEDGFTGTAQEVFETGVVNCLSFSHLLVGMARELEVDAYYLAVDRRQEIAKEDQLVVISGHVTVGFDDGTRQKVVEFQIGPELEYGRARPISDRRAQAHHYTNRGAEELQADNLQESLSLLETAVSLDPDLPDAWLDLGVARRRSGDLGGADRAYRRAMDVDPSYLPAFLNLAGLMRLRGDLGATREILKLLDRRDNRNPFILLSLGDFSLGEQRLDDARRFYERAHRLDRSHPETRAARGQWALAAGEEEQARRWLAAGQAADPDNLRVRRLAAALSESRNRP
jgi:Flp pilus assembly protein TadD